ncbi:MAG: signal peptidase II [Kiloniellales bacterium]
MPRHMARNAAGSGGDWSNRLISPIMRLALGVAAAVVLVDQLSKWWIVGRIMDPPRPIEVTGFFALVLTHNRGVSFGLFDTDAFMAPWLFSGLALVIVAVLVYWLVGTRRRLPAVAIGLIVGGAVGNMVDRLRLGAVVDFLDFHWADLHWPAFNAADSAIALGVLLLLADGLFGRRESPR